MHLVQKAALCENACQKLHMGCVAQVFGKVMVCKDLPTAHKVASRAHHLNFVTIKGEQVSKKGTITGGYIDQSRCALLPSHEAEETSVSAADSNLKTILSPGCQNAVPETVPLQIHLKHCGIRHVCRALTKPVDISLLLSLTHACLPHCLFAISTVLLRVLLRPSCASVRSRIELIKLLDELCINLEKAAGEKEQLKEQSDELGQTIAVILGEIQKVDANMDRIRCATSVSALLATHVVHHAMPLHPILMLAGPKCKACCAGPSLSDHLVSKHTCTTCRHISLLLCVSDPQCK